MLNYDYECPACHYEFTLLKSIKDNAPEECPICHAEAKRIITGGTGFILKGDGFPSKTLSVEAPRRKALRVQADQESGLNRSERCARGDFKFCRENDKILKDYSQFKDDGDREKIKDEYFGTQLEVRRSLAAKTTTAPEPEPED